MTTSIFVYAGNWTVEVFGKQVMIYKSDGSVNLVFMLHRMNPNNAYKVDHLGFYIRDHEGLTKGVHGLIGTLGCKMILIRPNVKVVLASSLFENWKMFSFFFSFF